MPSTRGRTSRSVVNMVSRDRSKAAWLAAGRTRRPAKRCGNVARGLSPLKAGKVMAHDRQQIFFLLRQRLHVVGVAAVRRFGGADQGRAGPRHHEHGAPVRRTFDIVNAGGQREGNHDVRALHQVHIRNTEWPVRRRAPPAAPRARGIDQHPRPAFEPPLPAACKSRSRRRRSKSRA